MKLPRRDVKSSDGSGSAKYLKFKDGETKNVIFRGEVYEFKNKWVNGKGIICEDNDPEGTSRFKINAIIFEDGTPVVKIWEFPLIIYNKLSDINSEYPLEDTVIKITRQGSGRDTEYQLLPLIKIQIPKSIDKLDLNILDAKPKTNKASEDNTAPNGWDGGSIPESEYDPLPF